MNAGTSANLIQHSFEDIFFFRIVYWGKNKHVQAVEEIGWGTGELISDLDGSLEFPIFSQRYEWKDMFCIVRARV